MKKNFLCFIMIILQLPIMQVFAQTEPQSIKIGYFIESPMYQSGFSDTEHKTGYAYEFYQSLAALTGWQYKYNYGTWNDMLDGIGSGKIDILANVTKTPEKEKLMLFSEQSMGKENFYIYLPNNNNINFDSASPAKIKDLDGKKIGAIDRTYQYSLAKKISKENNINCTVIPFASSDTFEDAVKIGEIDGYVITDNHLFVDSRFFIKIGSADTYFAVSKSRPDLLETLNTALASIFLTSPNYIEILQEKFFISSEYKLALTENEKFYIEYFTENKNLKFGYIKDCMPISGIDKQGNIKGLVKDVIAHLSKSLNISIDTFAFETTDDMEAALKRGEIDAAFPFYDDSWFAEQKGFLKTNTVMTDRIMLVYKGEYKDDILTSIAVKKSSISQTAYIQTYYPNANIVVCDTRDEYFDAVKKGKAKCAIASESIMQLYLRQNPKYNDLNTAFLQESEGFAIVVTPANYRLVQIFNKAIGLMPRAQIVDSIIENSHWEKQITLKDIFMKYQIQITLAMLILFGLALLFTTNHIRTIAKSQKDLAKAKKDLEAALYAANVANIAKSNFLTSISNDVRIPMNSIIGTTNVAAIHIDDKFQVKKCLEKISISSRHLLALLNELLDISKIESGKMELSMQDFSMADLVENIIAMGRPLAEDKKQKISVNVENLEHEYVTGDIQRLQQVFMNLISNSIKYTSEGGKIDINIYEKPSELNKENYSCFVFVFKDNGIGISRDSLEKLYQALSSTKDKINTEISETGYGLSISQSIVQMMNGNIELESEENEGTTFTVTIHLEIQKTEEQNVDLSGLNILIADSSEKSCTATKNLLESMKIRTQCVTEDSNIIPLIIQNIISKKFSALLIDYSIPHTHAIIRQIRQVLPSIPIIVTSDFDTGAIEAEAKSADATAFLTKPMFKSRIIELFIEYKEKKETKKQDSTLIPYTFKGKRVLLVEDNEINAELAQNILMLAELITDRVCDGKEAVERIKNVKDNYYDIILMDIQMPVMNGYEATAAIRAMDREYAKTVPIIAMTGNFFSEEIASSRQSGMNDQIEKPLDLKVLAEIMAKWTK